MTDLIVVGVLALCVGLMVGFLAGRREGEQEGRLEERGRTMRAQLDCQPEVHASLAASKASRWN